MIIYSKQNKANVPDITRVEQAIKRFIENESDIQKTKRTVSNTVFNIEGPCKFDESLGLEIFDETKEELGLQKHVENVQFMKEFVITEEMLNDCDYNIATEAKRRAEYFTRNYYKALNKIAEAALINGEQTEMYYNSEKLDISLKNGEPLFFASHMWGEADKRCGKQSNYFYGPFFDSDEELEKAIIMLCNKLKKMKAETGEPLGYVADTIIIPCNQPKLHELVLSVCCRDYLRHFMIVVLPNWYTEKPRMMIMSSEANQNLGGNVLFNRVPLVVTNWVDSHTGNYIWSGRCRFGVGFGSYKHILLAVDSKEKINSATPID